MEEKEQWKRFEATGAVGDYLNYRQQYVQQQRNEANGHYESGRDDRAGYHSPERSSGGL